MHKTDYLNINKDSWNKRAELHVDTDFYDVEGFTKGKTSLQDIELKLLGDIKGNSLLHLQCHFGMDTLSLERMGATCTGIDFSDKAIKAANELRDELGMNSDFICSDLYSLPDVLDKKYDIVFTTYGTIGWLPDTDKWAKIVSRYLKPDGKFVFAEFHPFIWMYDDDLNYIKYSYFNSTPIVETETGSYADKNNEMKTKFVSWNHGLGEVISSLINNGLHILDFKEYNYSPYNIFGEMESLDEGKYIIPKFGDKVPLVYSVLATK